MKITSFSKVLLVGAVVAILGMGVQYHKAFADGESFTPPLTISGINLSYASSTNTISFSENVFTGTENFVTQATCQGTVPATYSVTGPLTAASTTVFITNAAGQTVLTLDSLRDFTITPVQSTKRQFGAVCAGTPREQDIFEYGTYALADLSPVDVSSLAPGVYTLNVNVGSTCVASYSYASCSPQPPTQSSTASFTILPSGNGGGGNATGTITVTSENSQFGNILVLASHWDIINSSSSDICDGGNISCSGTSQTYTNQPANVLYTITGATLSQSGEGAYRFDSVQRSSIVQNVKNKGVIDAIVAFSRSIFIPSADASTCALASNCYVPPPTYPLPAQTLTPGNTIGFTILWNPVASMTLSETSSSLSGVSGGGAVMTNATIINGGTPGSELGWNTTVTTSSQTWLSVSPSSGNISNPSTGNGSEPIVISANPSGLSPGSYLGTLFVGGRSLLDNSILPTSTINVTFVVVAGGSGPSYFICTDATTNTCSTTSTPNAYTSCSDACGNGGSGPTGPITSITVNCSPSSVSTASPSNTSQCTSTVSGSGTFSTSTTWSVQSGGGTITSSGLYTAPPTVSPSPTTVIIKATSVQDPTVTGTTPITVTQAAPACTGTNCPVCDPNLTANPTSIVVPESSNLTYSCKHVTSCTLTGSDGTNYSPTYVPDLSYVGSTAVAPVSTASGTQSIAPTVNTVYTLSCVNTNYSGSNSEVSSSVEVNVGGLGRCEQNPNGAGCPQPAL